MFSDPKEPKERFYRFNVFAVDETRRLLSREGEPVPLSPKAFDLLVTLVENRGAVMTKEQLLELVWPNQYVEEGNLTVHISAVRKALGERKDEHRYIVTIPGQGYRFVANVDDITGMVIEEHTVSRVTVEDEAPLIGRLKTSVVKAPTLLAKKYPTSRRGWIWLVTVSLLFMGLVTGGIFGVGQFLERRNQRDMASLRNHPPMTIRQLTASGNVATAVLSPDGKYFVYVVTVGEGQESLLGQSVNGGNSVELLPPQAAALGEVAISSDGGKVFYELGGSLFQMSALGGPPQKILTQAAVHFSIAPDGRRVAFVRGDDGKKTSSIVLAGLDGTGERELTTLSWPQSFSSFGPAWSPDGSKLAIGASILANPNQQVLMEVETSDGTMRQLGSRTWDQISKIAWLHDGAEILYHARGSQSDFQIWLLDPITGETRCVTNDMNRYARASVSVSDDGSSLLAVRGAGFSSTWVGPAADFKQSRQISKEFAGPGFSWTVDGRLAYAKFLNNSYSLALMNADGSGIRQLTPTGFNDLYPAATRDGRYVVFQSNRSGAEEIWRVDINGEDLRPITTGGKNQHPDVTPDGRTVLYAANEAGTNAIWKISIDGGVATRLTNVASDWPRVSPDGKMFACAYRATALSSHTVIAIFSLTDGRLLKQFDLAETGTFGNGLHWSPDGAAIVYRDFGGGLWQQPLTGGTPQKLADVPNKRIYYFDWSRDCKQFAVSYDDERRDAVLLSNFR